MSDFHPADFPDLPALPEVASEEYAKEHPLRAYKREKRDEWHEPNPNGHVAIDLDLPTVGDETLRDLPFGPTPPQLVPPFLTPEGATIIYGPGGVGKGFLATYFARELVRINRRVTIIDFENHPREWSRRARGMGFTDDELVMVNYRAPFGHAWTVSTGSLAEIVDHLTTDLDNIERRADYLIIDSYTTATTTGDSMGGMAAAQEFFGGLARLKRSALVIAHVAGGQEKWPTRPFGSVFVHNLARETWAVERTNGEEPIEDVSEDVEPGPMTLELRNRKSNGTLKSPPQYFTFNFTDGLIEIDRNSPFGKTLSDMAYGILIRASKPMTIKDLLVALKADEDKSVTDKVLRITLERHRDRFQRTEDTPYKWLSKSV
jgi:KaiC/GvpD/RAD55 family RecA-like ATPase